MEGGLVAGYLCPQWHLFIIPNRAHQNFSKHAGNSTFSALVDLVVSNGMSTFEAKIVFGLVKSPHLCNVWENCKFWMLLFTTPNKLLASKLDISPLTTRSTSAEKGGLPACLERF